MPRSKVQRNEIKQKFSKHEIVWAKTTGYRWWPASITSMPSKNKPFYKVDFIGDRSYALLSEQKLAPYLDFRDEYEANKKAEKHFINAVTIAEKKYTQWLSKQVSMIKSKGSVECKTSQQKQQLNKQIQLPQIPENIQQFSELNQQIYLCSPHLSSVSLNDQVAPSRPLQNITTDPQSAKSQDAESEFVVEKSQEVEVSLIDEENRQKIMEQLLIKYKLNTIPDLKEFRKAEQQKLQSEKEPKKAHWKRKVISKRRQNQKYSTFSQTEFTEQDQMTRKIYRFLIAKLHSVQNSRIISLSLKDQIVREKIHRVECLRKVMEWIQITQQQNIVNYHAQWVNFYRDTSERERQKHSSLTMEDESEQIEVK